MVLSLLGNRPEKVDFLLAAVEEEHDMDQKKTFWECCMEFSRKYEVFRFLITITAAVINEIFMREMIVRLGWIAGIVILIVMIVQKKKDGGTEYSRLPAVWAILTFAPLAIMVLVHLNVLPRERIFRLLRRLLRIFL